MKVKSKIQKWGNSLGLRISGVMRDIPHFKENTPIEVEVSETGLFIHKIQTKKKKSLLPFSETELLDGLNSYKAHSDIIAKPIKKELEY